MYLQQHLETQNILHLKFYEANPANKLTLSFWVKSNTTGVYGLTLKISDNNSSDDTLLLVYTQQYSISSADTWEYKTVTFTLDSDTGQTRPSTLNGYGMSVTFWLAAGSSR